VIRNASELEVKLKMIPGVVETGLFIGLVTTAYIGAPSKVEKL